MSYQFIKLMMCIWCYYWGPEFLFPWLDAEKNCLCDQTTRLIGIPFVSPYFTARRSILVKSQKGNDRGLDLGSLDFTDTNLPAAFALYHCYNKP